MSVSDPPFSPSHAGTLRFHDNGDGVHEGLPQLKDHLHAHSSTDPSAKFEDVLTLLDSIGQIPKPVVVTLFRA